MTDIESFWKKVLFDITNKGHIHHKDDAEIKEILNISGWIDSPLSEIMPNYASLSKGQYIKFLESGVFNIDGYHMKSKALADYVLSLDKQKYIFLFNEDDFVYTYPERLKNIHVSSKDGLNYFFDQIDIMCDRLIKNKGSNRAVATLYSAGLDRNEEHIPCLNWIQALIRDDKLFVSVMFRSNDIYNAFPSNMHFITYVGLSITEKLQKYYPSLCFEGIYYQCSSAHYYTNEFNKEMLDEIIGGKK